MLPGRLLETVRSFGTLEYLIFSFLVVQVVFNPQSAEASVKTLTIREGTVHREEIELRRVFVHPYFKFPSLYNDIAVGENSIKELCSRFNMDL